MRWAVPWAGAAACGHHSPGNPVRRLPAVVVAGCSPCWAAARDRRATARPHACADLGMPAGPDAPHHQGSPARTRWPLTPPQPRITGGRHVPDLPYRRPPGRPGGRRRDSPATVETLVTQTRYPGPADGRTYQRCWLSTPIEEVSMHSILLSGRAKARIAGLCRQTGRRWPGRLPPGAATVDNRGVLPASATPSMTGASADTQLPPQNPGPAGGHGAAWLPVFRDWITPPRRRLLWPFGIRYAVLLQDRTRRRASRQE
jgi:hypothetical protein